MDILGRNKEVFTNSEINHINVPRLAEFNGNEIFRMAMQDPRTRAYLPELTEGQENARTVSCKFLFASKFSILKYDENLTRI